MSAITEACEKLATRQLSSSSGLMFTDSPLHGPKITPLDQRSMELFIECNPQYELFPHGEDFLIKSIRPMVFDNENGAQKRYCECCGYDTFEVLTVIRREAAVYEDHFTSEKPLSKDHLTTCLSCGRKVHIP